MFATLSYKDKEEEIQVIPASSTYFNGSKAMRHACTECRAKKVKCTGEKSGCSKCSAHGITCVYPSIADRSRRRRKQSSASSRTANTPNDVGSTGGSLKTGSGDEETCVTTSSKSPNDTDSTIHQSTPHNNSEFDLSGIAFDFTTIDHGSGAGSPDAFSWTGDHPNVANFMDGDDVQAQYDLSSDLHTPTFPMEAFNLLTPLSTPSLMFPLEPFGTGSSLHGNIDAVGSLEDAGSSAIGNRMKDDSRDCNCPHMAMHMLEELESKHHSNEELLVSNVLAHQKEALAHVKKWLDCDDCSTPTAIKTLLTLIIQRLTFYLEQGVSHYFGELSQGGAGMDSRYKSKKLLGELQVDSPQEWAQVMRVLLKIRARDLELVLTRLKESALRERRESQLPILASTTRRAQRIVQELSESN